MATVKRFEDLEAWKEGRKLSSIINRITKRTAFSKDFILSNQIRRAVFSVNANIAEGFERNTNSEFLYFLSVAKGSVGEVRNFLYESLEAQYITPDELTEFLDQAETVSRLIAGLMRYLQRSELKGARRKKP